MTVRWTPTAARDLEALHASVALENPAAASRMIDLIVDGIEALSRHPEMGRRGRVSGTRELVAFPYVVAYQIKPGAVEILAIIHGARRWPDSF